MRRRSLLLVPFLALFALAEAKSLSITNKCNLDSDHTQIGRCLRGYLDLWELVRSYESHAIDILFPVPFYNRNSVLFLCDAYLRSRDNCMREGVLKKCADDEMIGFVQSHMQYFCGEKAPLALEEFTCISRTLRNKTECQSHIRGPRNQIGKCNDIPKFLGCVEVDLREQCGDRGVAVVVDAIESFGCAVSDDLAKEAAKVVAKFNATGALTTSVAKAYIEREKPKELPDELRAVEAVFRHRKRLPRRVASSLSLADLPPPSTVASNGIWMDVTSKPLNLQSQTMEIVVGGPPPDPKSLSEIVRKFFAEGKTGGNVRRAPVGKTAIDEIEKGAFLETDPSVEIAFSEAENEQTSVNVDSAQVSSTAKGKCDEKKRGQLAQCYAPLIRRWDEIETRHEKSKNILLPIFNFSLAHITELCEVFQVTLEECLTPNLLDSCHDNEMIQFIDEQLGNVCSHLSGKQFSTSFVCMRDVMINSASCFEHIPGRNVPGMEATKKCDGMEAFYQCLKRDISKKCTSASLSTLQSTIRNFGCNLREGESVSASNSNSNAISSAESSKEKSVESSSSAPTPSTKIEEPRNHTRDAEILDGALFSYRLSAECTKPMQTKARQCVAPLMRTWISLREQRPVLAELTFPVYKYTRTELLELCDAYANVFLCAGFEPIMRCLNDELVRFARDHLGYQCSPQNIERFMKHYDCIMELEVMGVGECRKFVQGVAEPGKDQRKCRGVRQYHDCMKPRIGTVCKKGAVEEFEQTISEFGCEF